MTPTDKAQAKRYIDRVVKLNDKHGHPAVPTGRYHQAVNEAAAAFSKVKPLKPVK